MNCKNAIAINHILEEKKWQANYKNSKNIFPRKCSNSQKINYYLAKPKFGRKNSTDLQSISLSSS